MGNIVVFGGPCDHLTTCALLIDISTTKPFATVHAWMIRVHQTRVSSNQTSHVSNPIISFCISLGLDIKCVILSSLPISDLKTMRSVLQRHMLHQLHVTDINFPLFFFLFIVTIKISQTVLGETEPSVLIICPRQSRFQLGSFSHPTMPQHLFTAMQVHFTHYNVFMM